jgi:hypothetical protein
LDHLTSPGLAYSQILLARIYEPLVLVNTVISWIRLADLNPCTTCTMHISLTIFLFRSGIAFYFHLFSSSSHCKAKKKICVFMVTCQKNLGLVVINFFFFYTIGKTGNSRSGIWFRYFICEISGKPSFVEAVLWRVLCSQFRQKASSWINKTLLLIKQHITYMNISRYANIDQFVNIRYIFLLARRAYSWLFQLAQMWKLLAPVVWLGDLLTPAWPKKIALHVNQYLPLMKYMLISI